MTATVRPDSSSHGSDLTAQISPRRPIPAAEDLYVPTSKLAPCSKCEEAGFEKDVGNCGTCGSTNAKGNTCVPTEAHSPVTSETRVMCRRAD